MVLRAPAIRQGKVANLFMNHLFYIKLKALNGGIKPNAPPNS